MVYIALKPIRFDRNYTINEIIPENVVNPAMAKKHIEWGNIAKIDNLPGHDISETKNEGKTAAGETLLPDETDGEQSENPGLDDDAGGEPTEPESPNADETDGEPRTNGSAANGTGKKSHKK